MPPSTDRYWALKNSWWILTMYFVIFSWVGFLYIGLKVGETKWVRWALFYMIPMGLLALSIWLNFKYGEMTLTAGILNTVIVVIWVFSIVHALVARHEYLTLLKEQEESLNGKAATMRGVHVYYVPADSDQVPTGTALAETAGGQPSAPIVPDTPGREVDF